MSKKLKITVLVGLLTCIPIVIWLVTYIHERNILAAHACINNLRLIDAAANQFAKEMESKYAVILETNSPQKP